MTALIIFTLLAMIGFPTYQEYQNRAHIAEAENVVGTLERHSVSYLIAHDSFFSAAPNPASVPGINSYGNNGTFTGGNDWATLGLPISAGSEVAFSYQAFAGQTTASGVPVVGNHLHSATENMNLERGNFTASRNNSPFSNYAGLAPQQEEKIRFDWSDFSLISFAADETAISPATGATCWDYCKKLGGTDEACQQQCDIGDAGCFEVCIKSGELRSTCETKCKSGATGDEPLEQKKLRCYNQCGDDSKCMNSCMYGTTSDPKSEPDYAGMNNCNKQCRGDMDCWERCIGGDSKSTESGQHQQERCKASCGGDRKREEACLGGHNNGDADDLAGNCCRARCHGDEQCLKGCGSNSCEASCRGNRSCIERCTHGSCEASCYGDSRCIQRCRQQNCQHTCGGDRRREEECNQQQEEQNEQCVNTCVTRCGRTEHCRRRCDTNGGNDCPDGQSWNGSQCVNDPDPEQDCRDRCGSDEACIKKCDGDDGGEDPTCPEGTTWNGTQCVNSGGEDPTCPEGQTWNGTECVTSGPMCPEGTSYSVSTGECVSTGGGGGDCPSGTVWNGTACIPDTGNECPPGTTWNGSTCVTDTSGGGGNEGGECASFGVATPADFGVPARGVAGLDFVVFSAVGNFRPGNQCTLMVKVIQARKKKVVRSESIFIYKGE